MKARTFFPLALLTPLALASSWTGDRPAYQPKAGTNLSKHFVQGFELELDEMTMKMDGKDVSGTAGQVQVALKVDQKLSVTDHYEAVEGGRPTKLKRTYDEISGNTHVSQSMAAMDLPEPEKDVGMSSELEGATVVFTWDDSGGNYEPAFEDKKGDSALLENLEEDMDLRGLLPTSEVSKGDSWKLSPEAVKACLHPGGDTKLRPEASGEMMGGTDQMSPAEMIGDPQGDFTATYEGTREDEGVRVAVIKLEMKLKSARDMSDKLDGMREKMKDHLPPGLQMEVTACDTEVELDGSGELLWDLESGLVHSLHLSGEARTIVDVTMNLTMGEKPQAVEQSMSFSGTHSLTLTTSR